MTSANGNAKQKQTVCVVLPWDVHGASGIEQQLILLANHFQAEEFGLHIVALVSAPIKEEAIESFFPGWVSVEVVTSARTRGAFSPLKKIFRRVQPSLILGSSPHVSTLLILMRCIFRLKACIIAMNQGTDFSNLRSRFHARFSARFAHETIVTSKGLKQAVLRLVPKLSGRMTAIPNPFDLEEIFRKSNEPLPRGVFWPMNRKTLIYVGRLEEGQKNVSLLLKAMQLIRSELGEANLLLVGDGPDRSIYEEYVRSHDLGGLVFFLGWQDNPFPFIKRSDVLVLPSRFEGFGRVIVEALALGVPVVSTDCPSGPSEILDGGQYGKLTPVGDEKAFAEAVIATLTNSVDSEKLKVRARQYDVRRIAPMYEDIFLKHLACHSQS